MNRQVKGFRDLPKGNISDRNHPDYADQEKNRKRYVHIGEMRENRTVTLCEYDNGLIDLVKDEMNDKLQHFDLVIVYKLEFHRQGKLNSNKKAIKDVTRVKPKYKTKDDCECPKCWKEYLEKKQERIDFMNREEPQQEDKKEKKKKLSSKQKKKQKESEEKSNMIEKYEQMAENVLKMKKKFEEKQGNLRQLNVQTMLHRNENRKMIALYKRELKVIEEKNVRIKKQIQNLKELQESREAFDRKKEQIRNQIEKNQIKKRFVMIGKDISSGLVKKRNTFWERVDSFKEKQKIASKCVRNMKGIDTSNITEFPYLHKRHENVLKQKEAMKSDLENVLTDKGFF